MNSSFSRGKIAGTKKLLLTKWTAVKPVAKQKHFLVSWVIQPALLTNPIASVEFEAVFSKAKQASPSVNCRMTVCGGRVGFDRRINWLMVRSNLKNKGL